MTCLPSAVSRPIELASKMDQTHDVRSRESVGKLDCELRQLSRGIGGRNRRTLDVLHHKVIRPDVVQRTNVGVIQCADGFRFPLETFTELRGGNLEGNNTIKARVAGLVNVSHSACADRDEDFIRTQPSSASKPHTVSNDFTLPECRIPHRRFCHIHFRSSRTPRMLE
jgi:hypothetical protein